MTRNDVTLSVAGAGGMAARVELLAPDGKMVLAAARSLRGGKAAAGGQVCGQRSVTAVRVSLP